MIIISDILMFPYSNAIEPKEHSPKFGRFFSCSLCIINTFDYLHI
jgi:hypothetical protein